MPGIFDLSGKVALVTGGNRGIGLAMAEALAGAGADVVIWGRDARRNDEAVAGFAALSGRVHAQAVDVADERAVIDAMREAVGTFGRIDTVVANAGIGGRPQRFVDSTSDNLAAITGVNLNGAYWTLREGCRAMVDRANAGEPGGSLIGVSSLGAVFGMPRAEAYSASKAALAALMRSLAVEHGRYGIRANTVAPGFISTEMNPNLDSEGPTRNVLPRIPLRRWGQGADCAGIVVYLASDASAYHTGDFFLIDGGFAVS